MPPELDALQDPPHSSDDRRNRPVPVDGRGDGPVRTEPFEVTARKILQHSQDGREPELPPLSAELGEAFPLLGTSRTVAASAGREESGITADTIVLAADRGPGGIDVRPALRDLYRRAAREYLGRRMTGYARRMDRSPIPVELFDSPTRIVDCAETPPVGINWRVIMAPPGVVDHAVVHALAHFERDAHSERFRELVARHRPEFDDRRWLDPFGIALRLPP